jgi:hypothetical protein
MSTIINRTQTIKDRTIVVEFRLVQKSLTDDALIQQSNLFLASSAKPFAQFLLSFFLYFRGDMGNQSE